MDWLTQSQAAKHWVAEEPFEVEGDSVTKGGPKTAREAVENEVWVLFFCFGFFVLLFCMWKGMNSHSII